MNRHEKENIQDPEPSTAEHFSRFKKRLASFVGRRTVEAPQPVEAPELNFTYDNVRLMTSYDTHYERSQDRSTVPASRLVPNLEYPIIIVSRPDHNRSNEKYYYVSEAHPAESEDGSMQVQIVHYKITGHLSAGQMFSYSGREMTPPEATQFWMTDGTVTFPAGTELVMLKAVGPDTSDVEANYADNHVPQLNGQIFDMSEKLDGILGSVDKLRVAQYR